MRKTTLGTIIATAILVGMPPSLLAQASEEEKTHEVVFCMATTTETLFPTFYLQAEPFVIETSPFIQKLDEGTKAFRFGQAFAKHLYQRFNVLSDIAFGLDAETQNGMSQCFFVPVTEPEIEKNVAELVETIPDMAANAEENGFKVVKVSWSPD